MSCAKRGLWVALCALIWPQGGIAICAECWGAQRGSAWALKRCALIHQGLFRLLYPNCLPRCLWHFSFLSQGFWRLGLPSDCSSHPKQSHFSLATPHHPHLLPLKVVSLLLPGFTSSASCWHFTFLYLAQFHTHNILRSGLIPFCSLLAHVFQSCSEHCDSFRCCFCLHVSVSVSVSKEQPLSGAQSTISILDFLLKILCSRFCLNLLRRSK